MRQGNSCCGGCPAEQLLPSQQLADLSGVDPCRVRQVSQGAEPPAALAPSSQPCLISDCHASKLEKGLRLLKLPAPTSTHTKSASTHSGRKLVYRLKQYSSEP